ncbi:MAG: hypothetical protein JRI46_02060 [Deltaproteobacteria bacterium]|nr:hypothetical protein [Deltaproteobacteria bacterium]
MDGGAELFYEYHFEQACVQRYQTPHGEATVEIYQMDLPAHAYGIYTFDTQGEHPLIGQDATYERGLLTFWKGSYFVRVFSQNEGLKETILALGQTIAQKIPQEGARPDILISLPQQGMIQDSLLYFRGMIALNNAYFLSHQNVLSLGEGAEGITFKYTPGAQPLRAIMVRYPGSPQADEAFQAFCSSKVIKEGVLKDGVFGGKSRRGYGGAKLVGDLLVLVFDGKDPRIVTNVLKSLPHKGGR